MMKIAMLLLSGSSVFGSFFSSEPNQSQIMKEAVASRENKTERAYSGEHLYRFAKGVYFCAECKLPLFRSEDKYDAGNGWPSFTQPIQSKTVYYLEDRTLSFKRYEVLCSGCHSHLGHVFNDGPPPKHLRYCINSIALAFTEN